MLDQETKRKIDNARDILVGKVPDPKSQVEQITIALIYKFMDDMDKESEEMGGKASFFTGDYEKYSWSKIFDPRIGGFDLLNLYGEGIVKMNQNPNIPQLFRDIFKNAFLPYRDPETLKAFLKEINEFEYDHSERLGDAFEYLLSVMDSQGAAGQFRTPRHIIDFIVGIVEPKKNETVLDPACGTAGFLISSYKHILQSNTESKKGDKLTPDERKRMLNNFVGYDISPDMVRLSLVNMYLHDFQDPHIHEYDTLTSEDRWNDTFDVILANPPFMTPKGGIRPHNRFSIQAKRSEVLFVDYIAEHLNPGGRAGVIIPEGIIFQSSNAYKNLRKMLIENYLWAVVSLPAGIFNPYSGVKTSILLLDKNISKKTDSILFLKIENDGFDLGAQRRPIDKNDLPKVLDYVIEYKNAILRGEDVEESEYAHAVEKTKIEESGDWNLSGDRYINIRSTNTKFTITKIGDFCETISGGTPLKNKDKYYTGGNIPWIRSGEVAQGFIHKSEMFITEEGLTNSSARLMPINTVLIAMYGATAGQVGVLKFEASTNQAICGILPNSKVIPEYLFYILRAKRKYLIGISSGGAQPNISQKIIREISIPLPPIEIQKEIVAEIDGYQKIIDGARQVVENWKPTIKIDPEWEMVDLGDVIIVNQKTLDPKSTFGDDEFVYIDISAVQNGTGSVSYDNLIIGNEAPSRARRVIQDGDVLLSTVRPNLKAFAYLQELPDRVLASTGFAVLTSTEKVDSQYVYYLLFSDPLQEQMISRMGKGSYPSINQKDVERLTIPLPDITTQREIVKKIETEHETVNANKKLIEIYEQKIKNKIAEV